MENNFFDLVKGNFFNPFTNENKKVNYSLLQLINKKMSMQNLQVVKEDIIGWISEYVANCPTSLFDKETEAEGNDLRLFASNKINYFAKCGWLIEDYEGLRMTFQLDEIGIKILSIMENIVLNDNETKEFSGYVYNIYNSLFHFDFNHAVDIIEQIYSTSQELNSMLRGLNTNIKKFLTKLIQENQSKPKEILQTIFYEYQKKVVLKAFKNFREKDNPAKYKLFISEKINSLFEEKQLERLIDNYLQVKYDDKERNLHYEEAEIFFKIRLDFVREQFEEIEEYIRILDKKNTKYISTATSRLNFLLNEETDIEGRIVNCLRKISNTNEDFFEESYLSLFFNSFLDENSMYIPSTRKNKVNSSTLEMIDIDEYEEAKIDFFKLMKSNKFSVEKINEFVLEKLKDLDRINAKDINIKDNEDWLRMFLVQLYSENSLVSYKITFLNDKYRKNGYKMKDFIIERK